VWYTDINYWFLQVQCNVFEGARGEVALTAAGGLRQLPGLTETFENAALVLYFSSNVAALSLIIFASILVMDHGW
jgi:hypothetical protein